MRSIFWRIFVSFWLAMTLIVAISVIVSFRIAAQRLEALEDFRPNEVFAAAARSLDAGGPAGLRDWLARQPEIAPGLTLFVFGADGRELLGRVPPPELARRLRRSLEHDHPDGHRLPKNFRPSRRIPKLVGPGGEEFALLLGRARPGPFGIFGFGSTRIAVLAIALALSALVCWLLARAFSRPVEALQQAARSLAQGKLGTRVDPSLLVRRDEFGALAQDFDAMARGLERMLAAQRELLRNVSHELRSPLARIAVALELARRKAGDSGELARIERECDRLDALIGQTLRLARLEEATVVPATTRIDLTALVDATVRDARFEAAGERRVDWSSPDPVHVDGEAALLRSAIENVVRNAMRYTPAGTAVVVTLRVDDTRRQAVVDIEDEGPGVPDAALSSIFEPFVRVDEARDRSSGGEGLGLAITARAVRAHGGTVAARNRPGGGLAVEIRLPLSS